MGICRNSLSGIVSTVVSRITETVSSIVTRKRKKDDEGGNSAVVPVPATEAGDHQEKKSKTSHTPPGPPAAAAAAANSAAISPPVSVDHLLAPQSQNIHKDQERIRDKIEKDLSPCENFRWTQIHIVPSNRSSKGGQGEVREAKLATSYFPETFGDVFNNLPSVAVKELLYGPNETPEQDAKKLKNFVHEIKSLQRLRERDCSRVLWVTGYSIKFVGTRLSPQMRLITEWIPAGSIKDFLKKQQESGNRVSFRNRLTLCLGMAQAVEAMHQEGFVHGDIKPDNFLLRNVSELQVVAADLGLVNPIDSGMSFTQTTRAESKIAGGTLPYRAPELFAPGNHTSKEADIFALGISFWQILTGKAPHLNCQMHQLYASVVAREERLPLDKNWPHDLRAMMTATWLPKPNSRCSIDTIIKGLNATFPHVGERLELVLFP